MSGPPAQTTFTYDPQRRLTQTQFPSTLVETYGYDAANNLTSKTDRNSQLITYGYDALGRLTSKLYQDGTSVSYTYDLAGRLTQTQDPTGTYNFTYDNMDRLTQTTSDYAFDTAGALSVQYSYDKASNRKTMTDPQNLPTTYGYDVLNRLSSLAFNGQSPAFGFVYDALSRRTSLTRPNNVNTTYTYDPASSLLSAVHKKNNQTLDGATYTYDNVENRKTRQDNRTNTTLTYTFDNIYQLTLAKQGTTTNESYSYDLVGNRLSSLGVSPYQYNSSNELTSIPNVSYTYDNNGNTKTKTDATGVTTYNWDFENRLTSVVLPGAGGTVSFKYDPFGRRAQKSSTSGTTDYVYDGSDLIEEVDNSGNVLARYVDGPGFDQPLSMLRAGVTSYYQSDVLSSVTSLSNSSGALASTYTYDAYGKLTASTGTVTNPLRYTGRELDPETGIYYYRARYYDPSVGRFINEDPIWFNGGIDFYAYTLNNPVNWIDPFGLEVQECRRPLNGLPFSDDLPPHTFVYSTQSGTGYGLGPKNNGWAAWGAESGKPVPGNIEKDYPYDPSGKLKPNYQCSKVSDDKCFEGCVNQKSLDATRTPPSYQLGAYQCDTWANDIERQCRQQCKKK